MAAKKGVRGVGRDPTPVTHVSALRQKSNDSGWRARAWRLDGRHGGIVQTLGGRSSWRRDLVILERCVHGGGDPRRISSMVVLLSLEDGGARPRSPGAKFRGRRWGGTPSASILRPQSPIPALVSKKIHGPELVRRMLDAESTDDDDDDAPRAPRHRSRAIGVPPHTPTPGQP